MIRFLFVLSLAMLLTTDCNNKHEFEQTIGSVERATQIIDSHLVFSQVNQSNIDEIRKNPSKINQFYNNFQQQIKKYLPDFFSQLSDDELLALYSAIVAYSMAPYGNSTKVELTELLNEDKLDCDNYAILTYYLFREAKGSIKKISNLKFKFVGWDGGSVGNHAQIFFVSQQRSILLDPTIGIVAIADFNSIASGIPLSSSQIVDFSTRTELNDYRKKVINALEKGLYTPSDLLYYFEDFEDFKNPSMGSNYWPTPGAYSLRKRMPISQGVTSK